MKNICVEVGGGPYDVLIHLCHNILISSAGHLRYAVAVEGAKSVNVSLPYFLTRVVALAGTGKTHRVNNIVRGPVVASLERPCVEHYEVHKDEIDQLMGRKDNSKGYIVAAENATIPAMELYAAINQTVVTHWRKNSIEFECPARTPSSCPFIQAGLEDLYQTHAQAAECNRGLIRQVFLNRGGQDYVLTLGSGEGPELVEDDAFEISSPLKAHSSLVLVRFKSAVGPLAGVINILSDEGIPHDEQTVMDGSKSTAKIGGMASCSSMLTGGGGNAARASADAGKGMNSGGGSGIAMTDLSCYQPSTIGVLANAMQGASGGGWGERCNIYFASSSSVRTTTLHYHTLFTFSLKLLLFFLHIQHT